MIDSGSVAWMIVASVLVLFMTPGVAFFYGGLVRGKNVISTMMYSFISMGVVMIIWALYGYSLAFGTAAEVTSAGFNNFIGNFDFVGFRDVSPSEGDGIPVMLFAAFQMMFAIITPALITGAFAERFKFSTYLLFLVLWVTLVYLPICHWVWAEDGWIKGIGAVDFAGGTVVHINASVAAVAAAHLVGRRRNVERGVEPHNVPFVILGAVILWIGWNGFNAGSGLAADGVAVNAFVVTNMAAAVGAVTWGLLSVVRGGKMSAVGVATGAIGGLVAITPAAGNVGPMGAFGIGFGAGVLCYIAVQVRHRFKIDDALEVFAVHGVGGIWGAIATAIFAVGGIGLVDGDANLLWANFRAVVATIGFSLVVTTIILLALDKIPGLGLRADPVDEDSGLDVAMHGERAYVADGAD